jgi:hypothetical protein
MPSVGDGGLAAVHFRQVLLHQWRVVGTPFGEWIGRGHLGLREGTRSAIRVHGHQWRVAVVSFGLCSTPFSLLTPPLQPVLSPSRSQLP